MPKFITSVPGIGASTAAVLGKHGFRTLEDLAASDAAALSVVPGFGEKRAGTVIKAARTLLDADRADAKSEPKTRSEPEPVDVVEKTSQVDPVATGSKGKKKKDKAKQKKEKKAKKGGKDKKGAKSAKKKGGKGKKAK